MAIDPVILTDDELYDILYDLNMVSMGNKCDGRIDLSTRSKRADYEDYLSEWVDKIIASREEQQ